MDSTYIEINKAAWNMRTEQHFNSDFYDVAGFLAGKSSLKSIELNLLGDVSGLKILHLQCHFGQDSLSLARMGAQVTGLDLSDLSIEKARELNIKLGLDVTFVCCDVYDAPQFIEEKFDIVFTSYGTIGWLPDLNRWASVIAHFLKPNGRFVFVEFHPVVWMMDYQFEKIGYSYFNTTAIVEENTGSYTDAKTEIKFTDVSWNHSLGEVMTALIQHNIEIQSFEEFDFSPWNCFKNTIEIASDQFQIKGLEGKIPLAYSILGNMKVEITDEM
jgi:SAM-dependent methyltransferase